MRKEKMIYRFYRYDGKTLYARKEIPYEYGLSAQLILDELCFNWNKKKIEDEINRSFATENKEAFLRLSEDYMHFIWE